MEQKGRWGAGSLRSSIARTAVPNVQHYLKSLVRALLFGPMPGEEKPRRRRWVRGHLDQPDRQSQAADTIVFRIAPHLPFGLMYSVAHFAMPTRQFPLILLSQG